MDIEELCTYFKGVRGQGAQRNACCPAHDDQKQSLSISVGKDGQTLLHCHAGCTVEDIVSGVGLRQSDLFSDPQAVTSKTVVAIYRYKDANGHESEKLRYSDKSFAWRQSDHKGGYRWDRKGIEPSLYNTNFIDIPTEVWFVEGEKDSDNLTAAGLYAVSVPDGAGSKWHQAFTDALRGKTVCIIPDDDKPGQELAQKAAKALFGSAGDIQVIDLCKIWSSLPEHGGVSDLIAHMGAAEAVDAIRRLKSKTAKFSPDKPAAETQNALHTISAEALQKADLPPVRFIVEGLLPTGLSILAAPPKYGKSWLALDLCLSLALGNAFLGYKTQKCSALYLALEDSPQRLKDRMYNVLSGDDAPANCHYATTALSIESGLIGQLDEFLNGHPDTRLIVIDTLQRIRRIPNGRVNAYAAEYAELTPLKSFADERGICLLLVHHLRKMGDSDPFNRISGTSAIFGAVDTALVLTRDKRSGAQTTLSITGRDVESNEIVIEFDMSTYRWHVAVDAKKSAERAEYNRSPLVKTIKNLIDESPDGWYGTAQELICAGERAGLQISMSPQKCGKEINAFEQPLFDYDRIMHRRSKNGNGGGFHRFFRQASADAWNDTDKGGDGTTVKNRSIKNKRGIVD